MYHTQKALGIAVLAHRREIPVPKFAIFPQQQDRLMNIPGPWFARPCPVRPRHGFVESRRVCTLTEVLDVWREARAADPGAEIVIMPALTAQHSAVVTPQMMVIGQGNDGVTSGRPGTLQLPLAGLQFDPKLLHDAKITDTPYLECVSTGSDFWCVQLRDGPDAQGSSRRYVQKDTIVQGVLRPQSDDLLRWESTVASANPGDVVWLPGGNLLSHFAIHAVVKGLPISFEAVAPRLGETWTADAEMPTFPNELREGIRTGFAVRIAKTISVKKAFQLSMITAHHAIALQTSAHGAWLLGVGAALLVQLAAAACIGELRFSKRRPDLPKHRGECFELMWADYLFQRSRLAAAYEDFTQKSWPRSFGGKKWAVITQHAILLDSLLRRIVLQPKRAFSPVIVAMNNIIALCHNTARIGTRFIPADVMDAIATGHAILTAAVLLATVPQLMSVVPVEQRTIQALRLLRCRKKPFTCLMQCRPLPDRPLYYRFQLSIDGVTWKEFDLKTPEWCDSGLLTFDQQSHCSKLIGYAVVVYAKLPKVLRERLKKEFNHE